LHFRSNNLNYFASKLPKAALSREISGRFGIFEFLEIILSTLLKLCPARFQKTAR
jgi:hypothetical protein